MKRLIQKLHTYFLDKLYHDLIKIHKVATIKHLNSNIELAESVKISKDAKVEIRFGGHIKIGSDTKINDFVLVLSYGGTIEIGSNCDINPFSIIYGHGNTKIGNNVLIAGHCMIIPNNHNFSTKEDTIISQGITSKGIVIQDDVWLGHGCSILDGVTIGKGSVIAAGSVVNKNVEPYSVYGGVPAKLIKKRL